MYKAIKFHSVALSLGGGLTVETAKKVANEIRYPANKDFGLMAFVTFLDMVTHFEDSRSTLLELKKREESFTAAIDPELLSDSQEPSACELLANLRNRVAEES